MAPSRSNFKHLTPFPFKKWLQEFFLPYFLLTTSDFRGNRLHRCKASVPPDDAHRVLSVLTQQVLQLCRQDHCPNDGSYNHIYVCSTTDALPNYTGNMQPTDRHGKNIS